VVTLAGYEKRMAGHCLADQDLDGPSRTDDLMEKDRIVYIMEMIASLKAILYHFVVAHVRDMVDL